MANFPLLLATLVDGQPIYASTFRQICEMLAKCANFAEGSSHELDGVVELVGSNAEIRLSDGAKIVANGDGVIKASGSSAWLIANLSAIVSLEVVGASSKVEFGDGKYPTLTSRNLPRAMRGSWVPETGYGAWVHGSGNWLTSSADMSRIDLEDYIEAGATLKEVYIGLKGADSHGTNWPPEHLTHTQLYKRDVLTGVKTLIEEKDDGSSQSTYQSAHQVAFTGLSETFNYHERLLAIVRSEYGTDALAGTEVYGGYVLSTFADLRPI